ncbi:unnamed protein product, partial [Prorocentrum cordatum]
RPDARPHPASGRGGPAGLGVLLLALLGGPDGRRLLAAALLGVPLFMVNVMQFVNVPGLGLQASRISCVVLLARAVELGGVLVCSGAFDIVQSCAHHRDCGTHHASNLLSFWFKWHRPWMSGWMAAGVLYYVLLAVYTCRAKRGADLHSSVAAGEVEDVKQLLCSSELVLDINRHGPDGRTPLHLAALTGHMECARLLIRERADMGMCTRCQNVDAVHELLRQGADVRATNLRGRTASDCVQSGGWDFYRHSPESRVLELLRLAEAGQHLEMTPPSSRSGSMVEGRASAASASSDGPRSRGCPDASAWPAP